MQILLQEMQGNVKLQGMGVRGIPKVFINGKTLKKRSFEGFREMIEAELKKRKR